MRGVLFRINLYKNHSNALFFYKNKINNAKKLNLT
ncbi:hypothetical protein CLV55_1068 [Flavobacterium aciduliphilum]|uniref:Uncharacterized protein n=1 Tax=Flavobacterium aciduliphilum TaxID=1101402 RepID=A0A328YDQ8_9FLAO|nr:hypothetical protein CLV55_1068 [Flavobacterium aciduliphilum]